MLNTLAIANYRSLRNIIIPLGRLNVITGANASGKSNLYRALRLLAETAQGGVVNALAISLLSRPGNQTRKHLERFGLSSRQCFNG